MISEAQAKYREERGQYNIELERLLKPHNENILVYRQKLFEAKREGNDTEADAIRLHLRRLNRAVAQVESDWLTRMAGAVTVEKQAEKAKRTL